MRALDLTGVRFGKLVALRIGIPHKSPSRTQVTWVCQCDCGNIVTVQRSGLRNGLSKSCGCSYKELGIRNRTSRHGNLPEYSAWFHMKQRCENPNDQDYKIYGGRGIKVCTEWRTSFDAFFSDMGEKPSARHSIDRVDVDGGYSKNNCRWATPLEQSRNRRNTKYYTKPTIEKGMCDGS